MTHHFSGKWLRVLALMAPLVFSAPIHASNFTDETLLVDGEQRRFLVHDFSQQQAKAPLVIVLHGGGGSGQNAAIQTGFDSVAEREHLIAVYPYGSGRFDEVLLTWNAGHCCAYALEQEVDDVQFIAELIDDMVARHNVDATRVYVTGLSNGGMMAHRIGIELGHKVAAIAPVIASIYGDEPLRDIAVPTLIINGADDQIVKVNGGELGGIAGQTGGADGPFMPVAEQGQYWASVNACNGYITMITAAYQKFIHACPAGRAVERYLVTGNGHAWPGGTSPRADADPPVQSFNASEVIWAFFKRFSREAVAATSLQPYYYDGYVQIPALTHDSWLYSARLRVVPGTNPIELELKRAEVQSATSTIVGIASYENGKLTIPKLQIGGQNYYAALTQVGTNPLRFRLFDLRLDRFIIRL